ncbi:MAG: hypothetical protein PVG30_07930 [Gammaproteobacteria bacterium]|jgi:hypothetical protein
MMTTDKKLKDIFDDIWLYVIFPYFDLQSLVNIIWKSKHLFFLLIKKNNLIFQKKIGREQQIHIMAKYIVFSRNVDWECIKKFFLDKISEKNMNVIINAINSKKCRHKHWHTLSESFFEVYKYSKILAISLITRLSRNGENMLIYRIFLEDIALDIGFPLFSILPIVVKSHIRWYFDLYLESIRNFGTYYLTVEDRKILWKAISYLDIGEKSGKKKFLNCQRK